MVTNENYPQKKKYQGHHVCPFHDILTEKLKFSFPKVCSRCFSSLKGTHFNVLAWLLIEHQMHDRQFANIARKIQELDEWRNHLEQTYLIPSATGDSKE